MKSAVLNSGMYNKYLIEKLLTLNILQLLILGALPIKNIHFFPDEYCICIWITPPERLFSLVRWAFTEYRKKTSPLNMENQVFLRRNKRFWNELTVARFVDESN